MSRTTSRKTLEHLSSIIFWGAVWSIIVASFGSLIESTHAPAPGLMLFLISIPCLALAYRQTGLKMSPLYIAVVASLIRCMHLPFMGDYDAIITSVILTLIEGFAMTIFIMVSQLKPLPEGESYSFKPLWTTVTLTISVMLTIAI